MIGLTPAQMDQDDLASNPIERLPIVICIDTSGSMSFKNEQGIKRMDRLVEGIQVFYDEIRKNPLAKSSANICIVEYNIQTRVVRDFARLIDGETAGSLGLKSSGKKGDMGLGVIKAVELAEERKQIYKENEINYFQPWILVMSDGHSTGESKDVVKANMVKAANMTTSLEAQDKLVLLPVYIGGKLEEDKDALRDLGSLTKKNNVVNVEDGSFLSFFKYLGRSASLTINNKKLTLDTNDDGGGFDDFNF